MTLWCWLFGHDSRWSQTRAGAPCFRCERCDLVKPRIVGDVRPLIKNMDERFHVPPREQQRARWTALRTLRRAAPSERAEIVKERLRA